MGMYLLSQVQNEMQKSLQSIMRKSTISYANSDRTQWVTRWPSQIVLSASQVHWTAETVKVGQDTWPWKILILTKQHFRRKFSTFREGKEDTIGWWMLKLVTKVWNLFCLKCKILARFLQIVSDMYHFCKILADSVWYVPLLQDSCKKCMGVRLG